MVEPKSKVEYTRALEDFRQARAKARLQHLWATITGESLDLLRYDEITQKMHTLGHSSKGLKEIPVDSIVGTVNRYQDFDRNFLPLRDDDGERWARVKSLMTSPGSQGLDPIVVYKIGEAYFVLDGNHRVSIAKQMGIDQLEAYVTEIQTRVPLAPDDSPDDIILKAEYGEFLERTKIDKILPDVEFRTTFPGQYPLLEEHIRVHRHYLGLEQQREIPWNEAVQHWYEHVYLPTVEIIREQNFLYEFPEKTETDLYLWLLDHQSYLEQLFGWTVPPEKAAYDLVSQHGKRLMRVIKRHTRKIAEALLPDELEDFSKTGEWHDQKRVDRQNLISEILVPISGQPESWIALEQAIVIAQMEGSDIRGLVIKKPYDWGDRLPPDEEMKRIFYEHIERSGTRGIMVFAQGKIAETICERAMVNDLVTLKLSHPPSTNFFARLKSGMRTIIRKSTRPLLFVRDKVSDMDHLLLAYDGSPKGKEALYITAYFASRYNKRISVVVVDDDQDRGERRLSEARDYLGDRCVRRIFRKRTGRTSVIILQVADEIQADMMIMGGYGLSPLFEIIFGSTVDGVLRGTTIPVIVSQ